MLATGGFAGRLCSPSDGWIRDLMNYNDAVSVSRENAQESSVEVREEVDDARRADGNGGPHRRSPDFFIVGQHKSGTTALYEMLRRHPQIYMPDLKEPRFFASDLRSLLQANGALPQTFEDYLSLFDAATAGQRAGEASPSYLRSSVAAKSIA